MSIAASLRRTTRKIEKAVTGEMPEADILDTLKEEHEAVEELLGELVTSDRPAERKALLKQIKLALVPHVRAEEKVVYDAILALREKEPKINGEEGYIEHHLADNTLARLGKIANVMSPEFSAAAKVLKELVAHHVEEEERNVWSDVRKNFSAAERRAMNVRFNAAKRGVKIP